MDTPAGEESGEKSGGKSRPREFFSNRILWGLGATALIVTLLVLTDGLRPKPPRHSGHTPAIAASPPATQWSTGILQPEQYEPANFFAQPGQHYIIFGGVVLTPDISLPVDDPVVKFDLADGHITVTARLFRGVGAEPVEIAGNKFSSPAGSWDLNFDDNALEVVDERLSPRMQIIYLGPQTIALLGLFGDKDQADYLCLPRRIVIKPPMAQVEQVRDLKRIFKYPSAKFPSQEDSIH